MPSTKRLRSVCQSIAHHAVSGLSCIHPHIRKVCRNTGLSSVVVDLKQQQPCPVQFKSIEPLQLSLAALQTKFLEILNTEGFQIEDIESITLLFEFTDCPDDDYCSNCHASLVPKGKEKIKYSVNYIGQGISPNNSLQPTGYAGG